MSGLSKAAQEYLAHFEKKRWPPTGEITAVSSENCPSKVLDLIEQAHLDVGLEYTISSRQVCDLIAESLHELSHGEGDFWLEGYIPPPLQSLAPESELHLWRSLWEPHIPYEDPRERVKQSVTDFLSSKEGL